MTQKNITQSLIGKNVNATTATRVENLGDGEIGIANKFGKILTTDADTFDTIGIYQGGSNRRTDFIKRGDITSIKTKAYAAPTEQISYIGYNGTTGDLEAINSNNYIVRLNFVTGDRSQEFPMQRILHGLYVSDASATKLEVGEGIVANLNAQARKRFEKDIKSELVLSHAGAAITGAPTSIGVTKYSKTVTWAGTDPSNIAVGDYVRINGTAVTDPVYRVTAIDTTNNFFTIAEPYAGETGTILIASVEVITAAQAAAASVGIKLSGVARTFNLRKKIEYTKAAWETVLDNFGSASVTSAQSAYLGSGTYPQVATEDLFTDITFGNKYRKDHLYNPNLYAESTGQYACVTITVAADVESPLAPTNVAHKTFRVWFNNAAATNATNFLTVLGDFMGTTYSF